MNKLSGNNYTTNNPCLCLTTYLKLISGGGEGHTIILIPFPWIVRFDFLATIAATVAHGTIIFGDVVNIHSFALGIRFVLRWISMTHMEYYCLYRRCRGDSNEGNRGHDRDELEDFHVNSRQHFRMYVDGPGEEDIYISFTVL
jgi:hypothetical protein